MTIISHTHKFIYFKPRKVAGSSLLVAFGQHCRHPDIVTAPGDTEGFVRNAMNDKFIPTHTYPAKIKLLATEEVWDSYFKVTCVRNPWDVAVSMLFWTIYREQRIDVKFSDPVRQQILDGTIDVNNSEYRKQMTIIIEGIERNNGFYFDEAGCPWADYYIRYERIQNDYNNACNWIGLPNTSLPKLKSKSRDKALGYQRFFDAELRDAVYRVAAPTINYFGYEF